MRMIYFMLSLSILSAQYDLKKSNIYEKNRTKVMTLGTFHFGYPGRDTHKTAEDLRVDVLTAKRQAEIRELVEKIKEFKPTKVLIEWRPKSQPYVDSTYALYLDGKFELDRNEVYQIGYRIAKEMGLKRVYCADDNGRGFYRSDYEEAALSRDQKKWTEDNKERLEKKNWLQRFFDKYKMNDRFRYENSIIDGLRIYNDPNYIKESHGVYLIGDFDFESNDYDFAGVDGFVTMWYNRNLRIYRNIRRHIESENDRILMIIGAGHLAILNHIIDSAPDVEFVSPMSYLND